MFSRSAKNSWKARWSLLKIKKQLEKCSRMDRHKTKRKTTTATQTEQRTEIDVNRHCNAVVFLEIKIQRSLSLFLCLAIVALSSALCSSFVESFAIWLVRVWVLGVSRYVRAAHTHTHKSLSKNCLPSQLAFLQLWITNWSKQTNCTCTTQLYSRQGSVWLYTYSHRPICTRKIWINWNTMFVFFFIVNFVWSIQWVWL